MKNLFKKSIGFMLAAVVAMQGASAFALTLTDSEKVYPDGAFELCGESDIYVNEDFSGTKFPAPTLSELAAWTNGVGGNGISKVENEALNIAGTGWAKLTVDPSIGAKYVLSFDMTRNEVSNYDYPFKVNGVQDMTSSVDTKTNTFSLNVLGETTNNQSKTIAKGIPVNELCNVQFVYSVGTSAVTCDIIVRNKQGDVLGTLTDYTPRNVTSIEYFMFAGRNIDAVWTYDNVRLYNYIKQGTDEKITEPDIPETPLALDNGYILDEDFDSLAQINNKYTDADGNYWTCLSASKYIEIAEMVSGRKAMKLSANAASWFNLTPAEKIAYSAQEGASNKYVVKFGINYVQGTATTYSGFRFYTEGNSFVEPISLLADGNFRTANKTDFHYVNDKWCTVVMVYEMGETNSVMTAYVQDGIYVKKLEPVTFEGINSFEKIYIGAGVGSAIYIDNLQIYKAGNELAVGEEPEVAVSGVKLTTAEGDAVLNNMPENTPVNVSAEVAITNNKAVSYVPVGIFAAYKKLSDGSLKLVNVDIVSLNSAISSPAQKMDYAPEKALFTSDSEGGEYEVYFYSWKDLKNIVASGAAVKLG